MEQAKLKALEDWVYKLEEEVITNHQNAIQSIKAIKEELNNLFKAVTQKYHLVHPHISRRLSFLNYYKEHGYYCYGTICSSDEVKTSFTAEECDELKQMFPEAIREKAITK